MHKMEQNKAKELKIELKTLLLNREINTYAESIMFLNSLGFIPCQAQGYELLNWLRKLSLSSSKTSKTTMLSAILPEVQQKKTPHKKWGFPLRISPVNVTKSAVSSGFGHLYRRNPSWKTLFFVQCKIDIQKK